MSSSSTPRKRSIQKVEGKRVRKDVGGKVSRKSRKRPSTDHDTVEYCRGCRRYHVLPKLSELLKDYSKSPIYTTIPGTRLGFRQARIVEKLIAECDDTTLVVTNITSEIRGDTQLLDLFQPFGEVRSARHENGLPGNFGFVTFVDKEDAEKAMNTLNDSGPRGWDYRVLKVDWASNLKKSI